MPENLPDKDLQANYLVVNATLEIKNFFLHNAVRRIYDKIGQNLSLVMVNLNILDFSVNPVNPNLKTATINLVGRTIKDLREMAAMFSPETDLETMEGFLALANDVLAGQFPGIQVIINRRTDNYNAVQNKKLLVIFSVLIMLVDLFSMPVPASIKSISISASNEFLDVEVIYGNPVMLPVNTELEERISQLNGIMIRTGDYTSKKIFITIPLKFIV